MYISSGNAQVVSFQVNILLVVLVQFFFLVFQEERAGMVSVRVGTAEQLSGNAVKC